MALNPSPQVPNLSRLANGNLASNLPVAPEAITDLTVSSIGSTSAQLSWTLPAKTDNVKVYRRDVTALGTFELITTLGAVSSHTSTGLISENQYEWKVVASNDVDDSDDSNVVTASTIAEVAATIVSDGFESGDMSSPGYDSFSWSSNNRTSIVNSTQAIYNNGVIAVDKPIDKDWTPFAGQNSLRFRYGAGDTMSEQRFSMTGAHPDIWVSFWLKVPDNFYHGSANQKLFALWMDAYSASGDGSTVTLEFRPHTLSDGGSYFYANVGAGKFQVTGGDIGIYEDFITVPDDLGRWMNIVIHLVSETVEDASDGTFEVWRSWEETPEAYTKTQNLSGLPIRIPATGPQGFANGYLMGYANGPYSVETEFFIDNVKMSTESLL